VKVGVDQVKHGAVRKLMRWCKEKK